MSPERLIKDILQDQGIIFRANSRSFVLDKCIDCGGTKKMYIQKKDGLTKCFKCGAFYSLEFLVSALEGISLLEAKAKIFSQFDLSRLNGGGLDLMLGVPEEEEYQVEVKTLPQIKLPYNFCNIHPDDPGDRYLKGRGVSTDVYEAYNLKYSSSMKRVITPIKMNGRLVGWQGRDITNSHPVKTMNPPFNKSHVLLGYDQVQQQDKVDHVILVEGPFDLFKLYYIGGGVCSLGKEISPQQIKLINELGPKRVYLGFDPGATLKVLDVERALDSEVYIMSPPTHREDFGATKYSEIESCFDDAKRFTKRDYLIMGIR